MNAQHFLHFPLPSLTGSGGNCSALRESNMRRIKDFAADESGATSIEYGLIAAFIAIVIISAVTATGDAVGNTFNNVSSAF